VPNLIEIGPIVPRESPQGGTDPLGIPGEDMGGGLFKKKMKKSMEILMGKTHL